MSFPILSDPSREVIARYGVADAGPDLAMPAVFIVGSDGLIQWRRVGESMRDLPSVEALLQAATEVSAAAAARASGLQ